MDINLYFTDYSDDTLEFSANEAAGYLTRLLPGITITINNKSKVMNSLLPIKLEVTQPEQDLDQFDIHVTPEGGYIRGANSRSVLIGVYHYLYLLGCRFLGPGRDCELVPVLDDISLIYRECSQTAALLHRGVCIEGSCSLDNVLSFIDWLPKVGYNSFFLQFQLPYTFLARWYHHELNPLMDPEAFTAADAARLTDVITGEIKKRGLLLHQAGHGWTGEAIGIPSMDWKETSLHLTRQQRSMVAQLDGKRELFHGIPMNTNLCYSNPDVVEAFSDSVLHYVEKHKDIDYLHVWLADEFNNVCECEECQKKLPTDQYITILNAIDHKLSRAGYPTKIVFLLYQELLWPAESTVLTHPERFVLMFAPISRTFRTSYQIPESLPAIPKYRRNQISLPVDLEENLAYLKAWQKTFTGDSFIYDYPLGRAHYGDFGYLHISRIIGEDIRQLHKLGLNGYISCQELRSGCPNFLPNYVMGRMLFDETLTFEELADEYFRTAYGDSHQQVRDYLSALSSLCSCDYFNGKGSRLNPEVAAAMKAAVQLTGDFKSALDAIPAPAQNGEGLAISASDAALSPLSAPAQNVEVLFHKLLDYHSRYVILLEKAIYLLASGKKEEAQACWEEFQGFVCRHEAEFQPFLDVYRITEVSSKYTGFLLTDSLKATL